MATSSHEFHIIVQKLVMGSLPSGVNAKFDWQCYPEGESPKKIYQLFCEDIETKDGVYCDVDGLIFNKENEVSIIIEIEESGINPTKICGKFLTSALASKYIPNKKKEGIPANISDGAMFIQVLRVGDTWSKEEKRTKKWKNIEKNIAFYLPSMKSKIKTYKLFFGKKDKFVTGQWIQMKKEILDHIGE